MSTGVRQSGHISPLSCASLSLYHINCDYDTTTIRLRRKIDMFIFRLRRIGSRRARYVVVGSSSFHSRIAICNHGVSGRHRFSEVVFTGRHSGRRQSRTGFRTQCALRRNGSLLLGTGWVREYVGLRLSYVRVAAAFNSGVVYSVRFISFFGRRIASPRFKCAMFAWLSVDDRCRFSRNEKRLGCATFTRRRHLTSSFS